MYKVWIEINASAINKNSAFFRSLLDPRTELWAVVKSNAYGHGLADFSSLVEKNVDGFCVDSVIEAVALRKQGIHKKILVLGPTLHELYDQAVERAIVITISTKESIEHIVRLAQEKKAVPQFHLKIDSGMHRQGFYLNDLAAIVSRIKENNLPLVGMYTHFASAKDYHYPTYTEKQFGVFTQAIELIDKNGYGHITKHASATGGALMNKKYHLDAVRIGIGLYGLWPSPELKTHQENASAIEPVLSWHSHISEIKECRAGEYIGYDLTEKMKKNGRIAVVPIGYWHGYRRGLSGRGEVLVQGERARILGRVSMDMLVIDVSDILCSIGDTVTLIGTQKENNIIAEDLALLLGTTPYEIITCINPLIKRIVTFDKETV